jgi:CHAD domain-containing protein
VSPPAKHTTHVLKDVRNLVRERTDEALRDLHKLNKRPGNSGIHTARKRFKEIRALLRLCRDKLGERIYRRESREFQRVGRPLSAMRDATILIASLDSMIDRFRRSSKIYQFEPLRRKLLMQQKKARAHVRKHCLSKMIIRVAGAKERAESWPRDRGGWGVITHGLMRMYVGGRVAMRIALSARSNVALHDWRKRVTALRYALEALQCIRPQKLEMMARKAHALSTLLGDDHDLAVLQIVVGQESERQRSIDMSGLLKVIDRRRTDLQERAFSIGGKLFLETRAQVLGRLNAYWKEGGWRTIRQLA